LHRVSNEDSLEKLRSIVCRNDDRKRRHAIAPSGSASISAVFSTLPPRIGLRV
jgi:hypothetical protein